MTIGIIYLSERSRKFLLKLLIILSCIQLTFSACEILIGSYIFTTLANHFNKVNKERSIILSIYTLCFGTTSFIISIINIRMAKNCASKHPLKNIKKFHDFWIKISIISIVLNIAYILTLSELFDSLVRLISDTFLHGITNYSLDQSWKRTFDYFQTHFKCCGINKYTDWHETAWISLSDLPQDPIVLSKYGRADGKVVVPIVPKSCCIPSSEQSKCTIDLANQFKEAIVEAAPAKEIYARGCIPILGEIFSRIAISIAILDSFITALQFSIMVTGHYLYTSTRNSLLMGSPKDSAPGWLFGRADCGYIGGKSLFPTDDEPSTYIIPSNKENNQGTKTRNSSATAKNPKLISENQRNNLSAMDSRDETLSMKDKIKSKLARFRRYKSKNSVTEEVDELIPGQEYSEEDKSRIEDVNTVVMKLQNQEISRASSPRNSLRGSKEQSEQYIMQVNLHYN